ncbi:MAG: multidrug transporter [Anaerolineae bacterium]
MKKIVISEDTPLDPFNEPARLLRVMNKPLWLYQRDVLSPYCQEEAEYPSLAEVEPTAGETIIYRDNLFFDEYLLDEFLRLARSHGGPCQIAFSPNDPAITTHALPLQEGIRRNGDVYVADLFYYPDGFSGQPAAPVVIDTKAQEMGYYHVPTYMAHEKGDLVYYVPKRALLSVENWVHVFIANSPFGIFAHGARVEAELEKLRFRFKVLWKALVERKQFLSSSALVQVGQNTQIDPAAVIQGPTIIGDNVTIGPGVVINASVIGNRVNIMQGCQIMLSVVGDGCYLPFRASLFMTTLMENSMVAQNTCLQMCVIGRDTFIGAGNTFTDFNLIKHPIRTMHRGRLEEVKQPVLGGCVGHNCRIGSGHILFPARTIESDVVLLAKNGQSVISKNVRYEDSDHHAFPKDLHFPQYRLNEVTDEVEKILS